MSKGVCVMGDTCVENIPYGGEVGCLSTGDDNVRPGSAYKPCTRLNLDPVYINRLCDGQLVQQSLHRARF